MNKNLKITEDWERVFLTDYIYLQEESHELDKQIQRELHKKQPAQITIVDKDKILEKQHEFKDNTLSF
jgi:hypothetical protein